MKIYLDYIFLENLIVNTVVISNMLRLTSTTISKKKKIIYILCDTLISLCIYVFSFLNNVAYHYLITFILLYICIKPRRFIEHIKRYFSYYLVYYMYIGIIFGNTCIFSLNNSNIVYRVVIYLVSAIILNFILCGMWKMWKTKISNKYLEYNLIIQEVSIPCFVDTGNMVKDSLTGLNVIFVDISILGQIENNNLKEVKIDVNTVNGIDTKTGYVINNIQVEKDGIIIAVIPKAIVCFNQNNTPEKYSGIIGYEIYLDNIVGGVYY